MVNMGRNWPRSAALILMIVAAVFWLWFGVGSAYVERMGLMNWVMHILIPGGVFVLSTWLAWRRPRIGGALLAGEGLVALYFVLRNMVLSRAFPMSTVVLMCLTLALPPLAAGVLFFAQARTLGRRA
jgi:hypothetical protein